MYTSLSGPRFASTSGEDQKVTLTPLTPAQWGHLQCTTTPFLPPAAFGARKTMSDRRRETCSRSVLTTPSQPYTNRHRHRPARRLIPVLDLVSAIRHAFSGPIRRVLPPVDSPRKTARNDMGASRAGSSCDGRRGSRYRPRRRLLSQSSPDKVPQVPKLDEIQSRLGGQVRIQKSPRCPR